MKEKFIAAAQRSFKAKGQWWGHSATTDDALFNFAQNCFAGNWEEDRLRNDHGDHNVWFLLFAAQVA